ncbi:MAG: 23S rRNA (adenine(2503)-C(2))-methyltransferase RlmN [Chloroflexota bacterium]|nr:MAG: 23S rRNA (adenine(2503)-C(2))-methyltransferase RlmN [Chloroflexota bacterium]
MTTRLNLYDLDLIQLTELMQDLGQPDYRARQLWQWLYRRYASDIEQMTNLPASLRHELKKAVSLDTWDVTARQNSSDRMTTKLLFQLSDGDFIETVLMHYNKRRTICISTQAGCAMGCVFCATGQMGFSRNLSVGEIVAQVLHFARELADDGNKITNIVFMGMGEPLHNYDSTLMAVDRLTDSEGFNLGARRLTISTVGLVPAIRRYADERRQTPLAVSLHAASDRERNRLIPVARRWPLASLMEACRYYIRQTGRRLTFEWALIARENDTIEQAEQLGRLLSGMLCHVNLIPLNPTAGYQGRPSDPSRVAAFQKTLAANGVTSSVRVRRGIDIQAGCGQLRDRMTIDSV